MNLYDRIPNNVNLSEDKKLQRARKWLPNYLDWWREMGPEGFQEKMSAAHRGRRQLRRLGPLRFREDAGLSLGHLS